MIPDAMTVTKSGFCPVAKSSASLFGVYEKDSDGRLALSEVHCIFVDNLKKPSREQDKELPTEVCEDPFGCPLYSGFSDFA